jgi:hypothetical protein
MGSAPRYFRRVRDALLNNKFVFTFTIKHLMLLVCVVFISPLSGSCQYPSAAGTVVPQQSANLLSGPADKVELVYFHRSRRCEACTYAEERIIYNIKTYFQNEITSGNLSFQVIGIEEASSADLARKFGAVGSQLFINRIKDGIDNIRYVEEIWYWGCIDNEPVFDRTVQEVIRKGIYGK